MGSPNFPSLDTAAGDLMSLPSFLPEFVGFSEYPPLTLPFTRS